VVALFHFPLQGGFNNIPLIENGWLFVDFFFVLSGFVLAKANAGRLQTATDAARFVLRRFGRLWPLHAVMLLAFIGVAVIQQDFAGERHSLAAIPTNLLLIHGLGMHSDLTWNGPSWSISVEWVLYLLFAALAFVPHRLLAYSILAASGLAVLAFIAPNGMNSTFDYGVFRGLAGFFTGSLVAHLPLRRLGTAAEMAVVLLVAAFVSLGVAQILAPAVFGLAVYVFAGSHGAVSAVLNTRPLVKIGEWSYSIYMTHAAVISAIYMTGQEAHPFAPLAFILAVIGISAITFALIERPTRDWFNAAAKNIGSRAPVAAERPARAEH
jgi:peptidoglycan/LPS O-acetylase OafA/YrhL